VCKFLLIFQISDLFIAISWKLSEIRRTLLLATDTKYRRCIDWYQFRWPSSFIAQECSTDKQL